MEKTSRNQLGFTLIEMMLAIVVFLLLLSIIMVFVNSQRVYRRDISRLANMDQLEKALAVYVSETGVYPTGHTCITGDDTVIRNLVDRGAFLPGVVIADPRWPTEEGFCYLYDGNGAGYTLRFYLETEDTGKGERGYNYIRP